MVLKGLVLSSSAVFPNLEESILFKRRRSAYAHAHTHTQIYFSTYAHIHNSLWSFTPKQSVDTLFYDP